MIVKDAGVIWNSLKGLICVYKPADYKVSRVRKLIVNKICTGLNEMECREPIDYVSIEGDDVTKKLEVVVQPNLADHPMVVGSRYQFNDLPCSWANYLGTHTSGVLLLGLKRGTSQAMRIRENRSTRAYRVKGRLGQATEDCYKTGKVVERSTFRHVKLYHMEKLLANMQSSHQSKMFEMCGVDIQSQAAYDLAIQGPIRPANSQVPIIYGIKCIHFEPPEFTIEIHSINEYEAYLMALVHEIGLKLHSTAHCTGIQCIRHSYFTLDDAILRQQWDLQHIITNMEKCAQIIEQHEHVLNQCSAALRAS